MADERFITDSEIIDSLKQDMATVLQRLWEVGAERDKARQAYQDVVQSESDRITKLEAELKEWQDYWGCDDPHDSHVQAGTSDPFVRQLGKEQARANTAVNRLRALEEAARAYMQAHYLTTEQWEAARKHLAEALEGK